MPLKRRSVRYAVLWASMLVVTFLITVLTAMSLEVGNGTGFMMVPLYGAIPALLTFGIAVLAPVAHDKRYFWQSAFCYVAATLGIGWWTLQLVYSIEFERTPACSGMHSDDPGSGNSCRDGMTEGMTTADLRDYYRTKGIHPKPFSNVFP